MKRNVPSAFASNGCAEIADRKLAVPGQPVYFSDSSGNLYSYDPAVGKQKPIANFRWIECMRGSEDALYFGAEMEGAPIRLYSYDATGKMTQSALPDLGKFLSQLERVLCITECNGVIYYGGDYGIYSCSKSGDLERVVGYCGRSIKHMVEIDGTLYFSAGADIHSYDTVMKKVKLAMSTDNDIGCMTESDGVLYFSATYLKHISYSPPQAQFGGDLYSYDTKARFGKKKQILKESDGTIGCAAGRPGGGVYFGIGKKLCCYDGSEVKCVQDSDDVINCMTTAGGTLYFGAGNKLYSYDLNHGKYRELAEAGSKIMHVAGCGGKV